MVSTMSAETESMDTGYAVRVGSRLRAIRKQKRLSLQEVEAASRQEFKASVLGAYERGERAISVPRLQRLAIYYSVPVDQLLPRDGGQERSTVIDLTSSGSGNGASEPVVIDLQRIDTLDEPERSLLRRYLEMVQVQRGDFNGRIISIRRDDLRAIACLIGSEPDATRARLSELGLQASL
jgi:transcriptional regulator with XRE-family HTH domain